MNIKTIEIKSNGSGENTFVIFDGIEDVSATLSKVVIECLPNTGNALEITTTRKIFESDEIIEIVTKYTGSLFSLKLKVHEENIQ